jgi:hypothetical protein
MLLPRAAGLFARIFLIHDELFGFRSGLVLQQKKKPRRSGALSARSEALFIGLAGLPVPAAALSRSD